MTDTAKLRAGIVYTGGPYTVTLDVDATESLMRQAADEIEELRQDSQRLKWCLKFGAARQLSRAFDRDFDYSKLTLEIIDEAIAKGNV